MSLKVRKKIMNRQQQVSFIFMAVLVGWLVLAAASLHLWAGPLFTLALALLLLTALAGISGLARGAGFAAAVPGSLIFGAALFSVRGYSREMLYAVSICAVVLLITAFLCMKLFGKTEQANRQLFQSQTLIQNLQVFDPETGLTRWQYALQSLKTEIARSQRFKRSLCLVLMRPFSEEGKPLEDNPEMYTQLGGLMQDGLRNLDMPFVHKEYIGAILPETDPEGAFIAVQRLVERSASRLRIDLRAGVSHFPGDALNDMDLQETAENALEASMCSGQQVVLFTQINHAAN